jgi:hypothetical protein
MLELGRGAWAEEPLCSAIHVAATRVTSAFGLKGAINDRTQVG